MLIVAAKNHSSPKMVIQSRFTKQSISTTTGNMMSGNTVSAIPITTGESMTTTGEVAITGQLTAEEKAQTQDFVNSLIQ
ncbi:hypothetical protein KBC03_00815 [Patescibacteria group bacterium]|nr:hypothetical protein [Patescibacteria group bacterium]